MNESGKQLLKIPDSQSSQQKLCDACKKKDDEDVYIVFNVLYRVIIGDLFYQRLTKDDLNLDLELLQEERSKQITEEAKSGEEKLRLFQQEVSSEILIEIMTSVNFDQLLQEIFKSKYSRIKEASCDHQDFARHFIDCFNINSQQNVKKERNSPSLERLDALLESLRKLKEDIQRYNAEISRLPNHIMTRLFESHASSSKPNRTDDIENNVDSSRNEKEDDSGQTRSNSNNNSGNGSSSSNVMSGSNGRSEMSTNYESNGNNDSSGSNQNNGSGEGGSSEQSTESNNANDGARKRSKALPFKSKLPKKATDILKNWFLANINNPYPSHEAKESLSKLTGLTRKQIQNWFTNSRKRFLEPLKKKIEGKKSDGLTPSDMPTIEPVVEIPPAQALPNPITPQPNSDLQAQQTIQLKQVPQFVSPVTINGPQLANSAVLRPTLMPQQRFQLPLQQSQMPGQAFLYQPGMLPQGAAMQHGNNFVIVPYIMPQSAPIAYYRQPEFVPVNAPFIQLPQGNIAAIGGNLGNMANVGNLGNMGNVGNMQQQLEQQQPSLGQNQMAPYPYFVPMQQQLQQGLPMQQHGLVEMRPGSHQNLSNLPNLPNLPNLQNLPNLSNNYNTINNNIYNNINGLNGMQPNGMGQMVPIALGTPNMGSLMSMGGLAGIPQQASLAGMSHMDSNLMRTVERPGSVGKNQGEFANGIFDGSMTSPRSLQRNIGGIYHPRPELDEMNLQGRKHLHKDHNPENDTN